MPLRIFAGMLKKLGFQEVYEVGFGADMVARESTGFHAA
jgi:hypothetical protein